VFCTAKAAMIAEMRSDLNAMAIKKSVRDLGEVRKMAIGWRRRETCGFVLFASFVLKQGRMRYFMID
jgi:hypothetical protein